MCAAFVLAVGAVSHGQDKDFTKLKKDLVKAISEDDEKDVEKALVEVLVYGGADAVKLIVALIEKMPGAQDSMYWRLVKGVCTVTDRAAMDALAEAVVGHSADSLGRDLLFALQANRCRNAAIVHQAVLEKCPRDMQKMAIESLVNIEENTAVDALIAALKNVRDQAVQAEIVDALRILTRADCGEKAQDWEKWWLVSREQGLGLPKEEGEKHGGTGTVVDELERYRRDRLFGAEAIKLKALVVTDY